MKHCLIALLALGLSFAACADEGQSVLVQTALIRQQPLVFGVSGYGVVSPATGSAVNISFPRSGQVERLSVGPGQVVRRGETLFVLVTDATAAKGYAQAKSALEFSRSEYARVERLLRQQLATRSELAAAAKALADAQSAVREQERMGSGTTSGAVRAPFDGVVTALYAAQGDRVLAGKVVLQLAHRGAWRVLLGLQPEDLSKVKAGMRVRLHPVLQPQLQMEGVVDGVNAMLDPQTQLVTVSVKVEEKDRNVLVPGMQLRGLIQVETVTMWAVPQSAVLSDERGTYIFQDDHGHARRVDVTARDNGSLNGITGNIDPQLPVVVLGNYELRDGMALREDAQ